MRTYAAHGIVLRRIDLGEKDRILTIFSKEHGKLGAVAKGAKRPGSRFAAASEPFTYSKMLLATGRDLDVLSQAEISESFPNVRAAMYTLAYGIYLLELTGHFVEERQPNPDLFDSLLSAMYMLESGTDPEVVARRFELELLSILGYEPRFDSCVLCGGQSAAQLPGIRIAGRSSVGFSPSMGGLVCRRCSVKLADAICVSGAAPSWVKALKNSEPRDLIRLKMPHGARRDIGRMLREHIRYRLERELKSVEFIRAVEAFESRARQDVEHA